MNGFRKPSPISERLLKMMIEYMSNGPRGPSEVDDFEDFDLHIYSNASNGTWIRMLHALEARIPDVEIRFHRTTGELAERIFSHNLSKPLLILVESDVDFEQLLALGNWLHGLRIILVLHKSDLKTLSLSHTLRPRVLFYPPVDFAAIASVVGKMISK